MNRARVLIGVLGMDQHEVAAVGVARALRDTGVEVVYVGCFNTPETVVQSAIEEDIDVIGISSHSWEYIYYMPELMALLREQSLDIPVLIGGSVITDDDAAQMREIGVAGVFGSGSSDADMLSLIRDLTLAES